jgi:hypothetical protein
MIASHHSISERVTAVARRIAALSGDTSGAMRTFRTCLGAIERSAWPDVAWRFSGLMGDGSPLEFVFSSKDSALRYTIEVGGPEFAEHSRLDAACALVAELGHAPPSPELVDAWRSLQAGFRLSWGAWLGVRYDSEGEKIKVYIEIPREAPPIAPFMACSPRKSRLVMIGYEPDRGRFEHYFRNKAMVRWEFEALVRLFEPPDRQEAALANFAELCGMPIEAALRWFTPGYSLAYRSNVERPNLALFVNAASVGGASVVRRQLLTREFRSARGISAYRQLVEPFEDRDLPYHGIVSLGLGPGCEFDVRVGISGVALADPFHFTERRSRV